MHLSFEVGGREPHTIGFHHDKFWRTITFTVDDGPPIPTNNLAHFSWQRTHVFTPMVSQHDKQEIHIQLIRPRWLAGFRRGWQYRVFVNGVLTQTFADL